MEREWKSIAKQTAGRKNTQNFSIFFLLFFLSKLGGLFEKFFILFFTPSSTSICVTFKSYRARYKKRKNWKSHLKIFQTSCRAVDFFPPFKTSAFEFSSLDRKNFPQNEFHQIKSSTRIDFLSFFEQAEDCLEIKNHDIWHNKLRLIYIQSRRISEATKI